MKTKEKIIELLKNNYMTQKELCKSIYGADKEAPIIYPALKYLMDNGIISRTDGRPALYFLTEGNPSSISTKKVRRRFRNNSVVIESKIEPPNNFVALDLSDKEFNPDMVQKVLEVIARKNHFFVSEVHLQTEFIIAAAKLFPSFDYYPEIVPSKVPNKFLELYGEKGVHFDLVIKGIKDKILIEFKYLTTTYSETVNGFLLTVKNQSAFDIRRYDCWKDISRIELFVEDETNHIDYGYFILITNTPNYWNFSNSITFDKEFHIYDGFHPSSNKKWSDDASNGTIRNRERPIFIRNSYIFKYKDFYKSEKENGYFKSLIVPIK